ncbi:peptidoglycan DD-metalloendopeptidase family protein [Heliorestis acidaminivorans]|uniref:Peptidoglycan DD-metalloendopeptidase family protein n=1 Tax=Heliorestis acidaminivorans TaxID=553427 RepID=A0A6I0EZC1_9FIRM|nr:M23 family metallopeptidase [Heliorestis acidaminivorans]KAB2953856.1 peptidoglycan DD-metalloendopeptidase family protein [Heliorestis acidaminivorans]
MSRDQERAMFDLNALKQKALEIKSSIAKVKDNKLALKVGVAVASLALVGSFFAFSIGDSSLSGPGKVAASNQQEVTQQACQVIVNGEPLFVVASTEEADKLIKQAKYYFSYMQAPQGTEVLDVRLKEPVAYEEVEVAPEEIIPYEEALSLLTEGKDEKLRYVVEDGDNLWTIANKHGMNWMELRSANSHLNNEDQLKIGDEIFLNKPTYYLTVLTTFKVQAEEAIPFQTEVKRDNSLRAGNVKVQQEGQRGTKLATYIVSKANDLQLENNLIEEKVIQEPVTRVEVRGNQAVQVASRGSTASYNGGGNGTLSWPTQGRRITSGFGNRGREFHTGMDIDLNTGDPIYSAGDGVVVFAGWNGGYGNIITVDHGNGLQTRYAHLSQINVSVGQSVSRGAVIGRGGSTGRSNGPHLHFEVLRNGTAQNPRAFLN